jgi:hypothetical protein
MTTPTDDQIFAAIEECGIYTDSVMGVVQASPIALFDLYQRAHAAGQRSGMERAACISAEVADGLAPLGAAFYSGAAKCADAIRSAKGDM